jgi:outer membrane protein OmpA-like peptidoglycan-associated protein
VKGPAPRLPLLLGLLAALLLSGCAAPKSAQKSVVVLLPEGGKVSGEVTVANAQGSRLLNQSWQSVEIAGSGARPGKPVVQDERAVKRAFAPVLAAMPAPPVHYLLFFKLDSTELVPDSQLQLPEIVKVITKRSPAQLAIVGHGDTVGSTGYNYQLGLQRAKAVAQLLSWHGAAPAALETSSRGKTDLLVPTADQVPEVRNRRAEVTVR